VSEPDSIPGILRDFVVADIDGNGDPEVASILAAGVLTDFVAFNDTIVAGGGGSFFRFGTHYNYSFGATSYMQTSSVVTGDFDGDGDRDFVTTATSENQLVFLRNQGSFNFSSEPIQVNNARGLAVLDYDNDGDFDFVTVNRLLQDNSVTVFLNDGLGNFRPEFNCFQGFASGQPLGVVASDFDLDGRTDLAIASASDSVFVLYNFGGGITSIREPGARIPADFRLEQNFPNPFNPTTTIRYEITKPGRVSLKVYNLLGQEIKTLVDAHRPAGSHTVTWDGRDDRGRQVGSGVYFYKLQTAGSTSVKKMIFLK
ncbi:MAG: FG-GAP-like repeat-containing protein, partial [Acidobacteria bacterium]|nr:FG-GAP-like repeat-containing protein [Acidobacteriota bacterium]